MQALRERASTVRATLASLADEVGKLNYHDVPADAPAGNNVVAQLRARQAVARLAELEALLVEVDQATGGGR